LGTGLGLGLAYKERGSVGVPPAPSPKLMALRPKSVSPRLAPTNANEGANARRRMPPKARNPRPILSCDGLHLLSQPS